MNSAINIFLDHIIDPENRYDFDKYIAVRKISEENLTLQCGYLNGAAFITGVVFDQIVKVRYNYFEHSTAAFVEIDGNKVPDPVSFYSLKAFFEMGRLVGHNVPKLRHTDAMHWYIWEMVVIELQALQRLKMASPDLVQEAALIAAGATKEGGSFNKELKARACKVEFEVEKFRDVLDKHYKEEEIKERES